MPMTDCLLDHTVEEVGPLSSPCLVWQRHRNHDGYGRVWADGKVRGVHRLVYGRMVGPIPKGMCVLHRCDNPPCCNPEYLFLGTHADNMRDMVEKGRGRHLSGEAHGSARLTKSDVAKIGVLYSFGRLTKTSIGKEFGISRQHVSRIVKGERWREER